MKQIAVEKPDLAYAVPRANVEYQERGGVFQYSGNITEAKYIVILCFQRTQRMRVVTCNNVFDVEEVIREAEARADDYEVYKVHGHEGLDADESNLSQLEMNVLEEIWEGI